MVVHRDRLAAIARTTPAAMAGYAINVGIAVCAFYRVGPRWELYSWAAVSLALSGYGGTASMHINGTPYGLTPTQERTLRELLSAHLHSAERNRVGRKALSLLPITACSALGRPPTECSIGSKKPRHR
jgi:hypothetical protein